jgi:peptide/nickel transport system permease protein
VWQQYLIWMGNLLRGDFGYSYFSHQNTSTLIIERLPNTLVLMITAYLLSLVVAIPIGVIAAVKPYSWIDNIVSTGAYLGLSLPNYWFGLMLILALSVWPYQNLGFRIFPSSGEFDFTAYGDPVNAAWHLVLPAIVLAVQFIAEYSRFVRSSMLEVMNQDYIRTARAKGMRPWTVVTRHALRNSLIPIITLMGLDIPQLFAGALITEQVFAWNGMGRLFWQSAESKDFEVLLGILIILAVLVILGNLIADVAYGWADPRISYA